MRIVVFTHSLASCWNHGNAHFLRGVLRELIARGHDARAAEPVDGWSLRHMLAEPGGRQAADAASAIAPGVAYRPEQAEALTDGADLVIVHEWNDPALVARLGRMRASGARFTLLFHDTHHRAVSAPDEMRGYELDGYDGVLAFGEALAAIYRGWGWADRVHVWHEAADTRLFRPPETQGERAGLVWIGNWGDGERAAELQEFLLQPAASIGAQLDIHGVRYPPEALRALSVAGARCHGWLPNARAPEIFAAHLATVHVPRRFYAQSLPGIPTIRVFEALACGIPLLSAPWDDAEHLFRPGQDFLYAGDGARMTALLREILNDSGLRASLAAHGLETIRARHTCAHRVDELLAIAARVKTPEPA